MGSLMLTIALFGCVECLLGRSAAQRHSCVLACHLTDVVAACVI